MTNAACGLGSCETAGHHVLVPAISYYEALREMEMRRAASQIVRLRAVCLEPKRFIPLSTSHLEIAAQLWGQARRTGQPTADPRALDGDVILAAQAIGLGFASSQFIIATTNLGHIARYAPCSHVEKATLNIQISLYLTSIVTTLRTT